MIVAGWFGVYLRLENSWLKYTLTNIQADLPDSLGLFTVRGRTQSMFPPFWDFWPLSLQLHNFF